MTRDILSIIQTRMNTFSKGQKLIARFILESYDKAAFMTASRLGKTVNVSESTVVRFAAELGYDGYPSMQKALQEMIRNKLTSIQRIEVANDRIGNQDVLSMVMQSDIEKIRMTMEETDRESFKAAVDAILAAKRIYILGVRSAAALADFIGFYFNLIFDNIALVHTTSASEIFEQLLRVGPEDAVIGISFPRYSKMTVNAVQYAREKGADVVAITDSTLAPLYPLASAALLVRSDMISFVDSITAPLSLLNALIVTVGQRKNEEVPETFSELERVWSQYSVFGKTEDE